MLKLLVSPETRTILGVHVLGTNATEVVHIGQTVMGLSGTIDYLVDGVVHGRGARCAEQAHGGLSV